MRLDWHLKRLSRYLFSIEEEGSVAKLLSVTPGYAIWQKYHRANKTLSFNIWIYWQRVRLDLAPDVSTNHLLNHLNKYLYYEYLYN